MFAIFVGEPGIRLAQQIIMNDAPRCQRCPLCNSDDVEMVKETAPQSYRCMECRHVWDQPYARRAPDRRSANRATS